MAEMLHAIQIAALPQTVFNAVSTQDGLRGWWTADSAAEPKVGSIAEFGFGNHATAFRMKISECNVETIVWECLGDVDEWRGTRLVWSLLAVEGGTFVRFTHSGWKSVDGWFAQCNSTWGELMHRLKAYVEGKNPGRGSAFAVSGYHSVARNLRRIRAAYRAPAVFLARHHVSKSGTLH